MKLSIFSFTESKADFAQYKIVKRQQSAVEEYNTCLCSPFLLALQSPIEYQRRESKSNSLGRSMRPPLSATSSLRPHSSASIDRHKLPSLHSHNTSLPALYLPSQVQSQGPNESFSQRDVGVTVRRSNAVYLFVRPLQRSYAF